MYVYIYGLYNLINIIILAHKEFFYKYISFQRNIKI